MIAPGTLLQNRYLVERQIGQGGMGAVFVATDQRFGSRVALKETFFTDGNLRRAFEREARLLNRLRHAALPRVSDHFDEDEGQFLVMEYIPGEDLSEMLKRQGGPFPARDVLAWADQLLDALDYLHTQEPSVVHRDIKPQNLKLLPRNQTNQIVLLDFGLAKGTPLQTRVTATGSLFGYSFNYAPIEQMQGTGTDPRSDLYSLGATLYHLLTGAPPPDALTRATAVLNGDADPLKSASEMHAQVPVEVAEALSRAMSQSAARRFASALEMREALSIAGRHVGDAGAATLAQADVLTVVNSEQETRLMSAESGDASPTIPAVAQSKETGVAAHETNGRDDATVIDAAAATRAATRAGEADSVVTRVAPSLQRPPKRSGSRAALGVAASVVALALVGVGVYSLTQRGATPDAVEQASPRTLQPQAAQPAEPTPVEPEAVDAPVPEATSAPARRASTATPRGAKPPGDAPPQEAPTPLAVREAPALPEPVRPTAPAPASPEQAAKPLTREEVQEVLRNAGEERRRARLLRRRILEEQRRGEDGTPLPPRRPRRP